MKASTALIGTLAAAGLLITSPSLGQTTDGTPPAEESVCDVLKAEGTTKGLYGLCVAFCEAQDHAALDVTLTEEELEALAAAAPSGKILENYNRKRQEADPAMPCIRVAPPCPCFSQDEVNSIDGYAPNGTSIGLACSGNSNGTTKAIFEDQQASSLNWQRAYANKGTYGFCIFENRQSSPAVYRYLSVYQNTLTRQEAIACVDMIATRCDTVGL